jgi:hypothetical protein
MLGIPTTATSSPTATSTPTVAPSPTQTTTATETPAPTSDPYPVVILSPDGKLSAKMHINRNNLYDKPVIEVWGQNESILWKIPYQWDWDPLIFPQTALDIYGWSPDSSKLYFYYSLSYDTGAPTFGFVRGLQSLNISTGETQYILPSPPKCPTAFAFSSDMSRIAYVAVDQVGIIDLVAGTNKSVKILTDGFNDAGWIYFSPSEDKLLYHTIIYGEHTYAIILDVPTMQQKIIWDEYYLFAYTFDGWVSEDTLRYIDLNNDVIFVNLKPLSHIAIGTPTPTP